MRPMRESNPRGVGEANTAGWTGQLKGIGPRRGTPRSDKNNHQARRWVNETIDQEKLKIEIAIKGGSSQEEN